MACCSDPDTYETDESERHPAFGGFITTTTTYEVCRNCGHKRKISSSESRDED